MFCLVTPIDPGLQELTVTPHIPSTGWECVLGQRPFKKNKKAVKYAMFTFLISMLLFCYIYHWILVLKDCVQINFYY